MDIVIAIVAILIGLAVCFMGYRLFRVLLPLAGLVAGYALEAGLVQPDQWLLAILMGVAVAIVFAVLAWMFWSLAVIIGGAMLGFGLGWQVGVLLFVPGLIPLIIAVIVAIAAAVLFAKLRKVGIMILTAANGASGAIYGLGLLLPFLGLNSRPNIIATLIIVVLAVVGFFAQYSMHKAQNLYIDIGY